MRSLATLRLLLEVDGRWPGDGETVKLGALIAGLVSSEAGRAFLGVNTWDGKLWYRAEAMEELAGWLDFVAEIDAPSDPELLAALEDALIRLADAHEKGGYRVSGFLKALEEK